MLQHTAVVKDPTWWVWGGICKCPGLIIRELLGQCLFKKSLNLAGCSSETVLKITLNLKVFS